MDAIELELVEELLVGKMAENGGRKAASTEEGKKRRENLWVAVDEDGLSCGGERS